jgi:hypothetical protein
MNYSVQLKKIEFITRDVLRLVTENQKASLLLLGKQQN